MKTTSVAHGQHFEDFIQACILSGRYNNASVVIRSGLRLLEDQEQKMAVLCSALLYNPVENAKAKILSFLCNNKVN